MSIPEVPPDGEPRARQEGAWVLTYGKAVLDQFIADIRAMLAEMRAMYDAFMAAQGSGGGTKTVGVFDDTPFTVTDETHVVIAYTGTGSGLMSLILPPPTVNRVITMVVTIAPNFGGDTVLNRQISVTVSDNSYINAEDDSDTTVYLRTGITYIAMVVDGEWYIPDAAAIVAVDEGDGGDMG